MNLEAVFDIKRSSPEKNLLVAMLERALLDYFGNQPAEREEADAWLFNDADESEEFSFPWICSELELNRERVLARLVEMNSGTSVMHNAGHWWGIRRHA